MRFVKSMHFMKSMALVMIALVAMSCSASARNPKNTIYLDLKDGRVVIELLPDIAPNHVKRIKELARAGFYNGLKFHRVIDGFMAQTGDPTGTGRGGSQLPNLQAEFVDTETFSRGAVGMARVADPNSANSQFFIVLEDSEFLDGKYTLFGRVVEGMQFVDNIAKGEPPANPDTIIKMQVAADAIAAEQQKKEQ